MNGPVRIGIGEYTCWTLPDGEMTHPGSMFRLPEFELPEVATYAALLVDTGSTRILIDAGAGTMGPNTGKLPQSLAAAGFAPDDIHVVILSHAHPDHEGDLRLFSNAAVVMMRKEYEFWSSAETKARLEVGELYRMGGIDQSMEATFRDQVAPAADRLRLLERPTEIAAGVLVFPAPGHTPGHAAVLVSSGRQQLLVVGDAVVHPVYCEHPEWPFPVDLARDEMAHTRRQLLERAAADRCLVAGYHLPGVVGAVTACQSAFHWEPVAGAEASV